MNELQDLTSKNRTIYAYRYNFTTVQKINFRPFENLAHFKIRKFDLQMFKNLNHKWAKDEKSKISEIFRRKNSRDRILP